MDETDEQIRVVALLDMDTFYTQVEERQRPELRGKPMAVVQITTNGAIGQAIAVNYPARAYGVRRGMNAAEMRDHCPTIHLCRVPPMEGIAKGDLSRYRNASDEVFRVLDGYSEKILVEKASVDEAYLDLTKACMSELSQCTPEEWAKKLLSQTEDLFPSTFLVNQNDKQQENWEERRLESLKEWIRENGQRRQQLAIALGTMLIEKIRRRIKEVTQFTCSAGIAHNKILAKLVCSRHKPACQTVIVPQHLPVLYKETSIRSVRGLGGIFGHQLMKQFGAKTLADLQLIPHEQILTHFPDSAFWLIRLLEGDNDEPISERIGPKSIGVSKNFPGLAMLTTISSVKTWAHGLSAELSKRLIDDDVKFGRTARNLVAGFTTSTETHNVRTLSLPNYDLETINKTIWNFMKTFNKKVDDTEWYPPIRHIHLSASRFEPSAGKDKKITVFFKKPEKFDNNDDIIFVEEIKEEQPKTEKGGKAREKEDKENLMAKAEDGAETSRNYRENMDDFRIDNDTITISDDDEMPETTSIPLKSSKQENGRRNVNHSKRSRTKRRLNPIGNEIKMKKPIRPKGVPRITQFFSLKGK